MFLSPVPASNATAFSDRKPKMYWCTIASGAFAAKRAAASGTTLPSLVGRSRNSGGDAGFGDLTVDLTPRTLPPETVAPISAEEGRKVYQRYGCAACHANEANAVSRLGPNFKGLFGSSRTISGGVVRVTADEGYLRESILEPGAKVVTGFERLGMGMPSFAGVLTDAQIESIVLYIKSLQ